MQQTAVRILKENKIALTKKPLLSKETHAKIHTRDTLELKRKVPVIESMNQVHRQVCTSTAKQSEEGWKKKKSGNNVKKKKNTKHKTF